MDADDYDVLKEAILNGMHLLKNVLESSLEINQTVVKLLLSMQLICGHCSQVAWQRIWLMYSMKPPWKIT